MKTSQFIKSMISYFAKTVPGSIVSTVTKKQPELEENEYIADLHAHPYIVKEKDLIDTLDIMADNNVSLLSITSHGQGHSNECDLNMAKQILKYTDFAKNTDYLELENSIHLNHRGKQLTLIGGFEYSLAVEGIKGKMDFIALMPDPEFDRSLDPKFVTFEQFISASQEYNAITMAAHPYTLSDPYGPFGFFKFRLADQKEREIIRDNVFPNVDTADLVASNCAWMVYSNEQVEEDYHGKPLTNSDTHGVNHYTRKEIGRAGNIFSFPREKSDEALLREKLHENIKLGNFRSYLNYTPSLQFITGVAFNKLMVRR